MVRCKKPVPGLVLKVAAERLSNLDETLIRLASTLFKWVVQVPLMLPEGKT